MDDPLYSLTAPFYDHDPWLKDLLKLEVPFIERHAQPGGSDILEPACGTGRICLALAERGHNVMGTDLSETMLKEFRSKREQSPFKDRLQMARADMADFDLGKKFDVILLLARTFHVLTAEATRRGCLRSVARHLKPNGVFILNLMKIEGDVAAQWVYPEKTAFEHVDPTTGTKIVKRHRGIAVDTVKKQIQLERIFRIEEPGKEPVELREPLISGYFSRPEIDEMLRSEGFFIDEEFGHYDGSPSGKGTERVLVCRKKRDVPVYRRAYKMVKKMAKSLVRR